MTSLEDLAEAVVAAERQAMERYAYVAPRILDVPRLRPPFGTALRIRLSVLGAVRPEMPVGRHSHLLAVARRQAEAAQDRALRTTERLDQLLEVRARLRGRLDAYQAYAQNKAFEQDDRPLEDEELDARYTRAYQLLYRGPVDLDRAARYVRRYVAAVRRRFPEDAP
jgi:hypothetical protein